MSTAILKKVLKNTDLMGLDLVAHSGPRGSAMSVAVNIDLPYRGVQTFECCGGAIQGAWRGLPRRISV